MTKVIVPGFATNIKFFNEFISLNPDIEFISNKTNSYNEFVQKMNIISGQNEKLNIFAWSLGSLFSLKWTIENPDRINSLFLTGATARFCEKENYNNGISKNKLDQMIRLIKIKPEIVMNEFYSSLLNNVMEKEKYLSILIKNIPDNESLNNGLTELASIDLLNDLHKIKIPVFILQGNKDMITPLQGAEILNDSLKNSTLEEIDGGHSIFIEDKILCSSLWKDFLCSVT